jgi:hypothetical protein
MEANRSKMAKHECAHWALEMVSLRINGSKIMSNTKQKLQAQLHDGDLQTRLPLGERGIEQRYIQQHFLGSIWHSIPQVIQK